MSNLLSLKVVSGAFAVLFVSNIASAATFNCPGTTCTIDYGYLNSGGSWVEGGTGKKLPTGTYTCNNDFFGKDPFVNVHKICTQDGQSAGTKVLEGNTFTVQAGPVIKVVVPPKVFACNGSACTIDFGYLNSGSWALGGTGKVLPQGTYVCNAALFGKDPFPGHAKICTQDYQANGISVNDGDSFIVKPSAPIIKFQDIGTVFKCSTPTCTIDFGFLNSGSWALGGTGKKLPTGHYVCNTTTFGKDPFPGHHKICTQDYQATGASADENSTFTVRSSADAPK